MNGDFETDEGWIVANTPVKARYSDVAAHTGRRALQLGIVDPGENRFSYTSVEQHFSLPAGQSAVISWWYHAPDGGGSGDYGYFLLKPDGGSWRIIRIIREATLDWTQIEVDVGHYAGRSFTLRLGMRNDGAGDGAAAVMYVDSLSLQVCRP